MVVGLSSRVTDVVPQARRAIVGITGQLGSFKLLRDWEVLVLLNRCNVKAALSEGAISIEALTSWRSSAMSAMNGLLNTLDFEFESRVVKEAALLWPEATT